METLKPSSEAQLSPMSPSTHGSFLALCVSSSFTHETGGLSNLQLLWGGIRAYYKQSIPSGAN